MAKVCEICGQKEETDQHEEKYDVLGLCESCLKDRSSTQQTK
ncbi:hypothetical protein [Salibacterium salarium]|nr:hypothetical protein [Salibacterium salarium]